MNKFQDEVEEKLSFKTLIRDQIDEIELSIGKKAFLIFCLILTLALVTFGLNLVSQNYFLAESLEVELNAFPHILAFLSNLKVIQTCFLFLLNIS